jgi:uncharacterized membrane protein (UPF0127 family)
MDKKFFFQILGLVIVILTATALTFNPQLIPNLGSGKNFTKPQTATNSVLQIVDPTTLQVKAQIAVEVADTKESRSLGLGGRSSLGAESGMLFVMEQRAKPTFWMKGMLIPLDFIWILDNKVVDILENVPPPEEAQADETLPRYSPVSVVNRVLEVNSGFVSKHSIKIGDIIQLGPQADSQSP